MTETINMELRWRFPTAPRTLGPMLMQCFAAVLIASVLAVAGAEDRGWKPLFDGKTLEGWIQKGGAAKYRIENGELVGTSGGYRTPSDSPR